MRLTTPSPDLYWSIEVPNWGQLPGAEQRSCSAIVEDYGGALNASGHGRFRRYRTAEVCAHTLRSQFGVEPGLQLTLGSTLPAR